MTEPVADRPVGEFVAALTDDSRLGGGSTAAVTGAMAAALAELAAGVGGDDRPPDGDVDLGSVSADLAAERIRLLELADEDAAAFAALRAAHRRRDDGGATVEEASERAVSVPLSIAERCLAVLDGATLVAAAGAGSAVTDAGAAGYLASAGVRAAVDTARANFDALGGDEFVTAARTRIERLRADRRARVAELRTSVHDRV